MIYTIDQIKKLAEPIAHKFHLRALWVFGSYARGEATEDSDVDFLMDDSGSLVTKSLPFLEMAEEFESKFNKKVDLVTVETLKAPTTKRYFSRFINTVTQERVIIYEK